MICNFVTQSRWHELNTYLISTWKSTNFKFFQQIDLVENGEKGEQNKHMVVNTEWGAFGNQA